MKVACERCGLDAYRTKDKTMHVIYWQERADYYYVCSECKVIVEWKKYKADPHDRKSFS